MADLNAVIETMEHRWMRAWIRRDSKALKELTSRRFRLLVGSKPGVILDSRSWLEAATTRYLCKSYRFGDIYVRNHGSMILFATQLELEATMDGEDWSGMFWATDLWAKSRIRRSWRMADRVMSRVEDSPKVPPAIRSLQLWK